MPAIILTLNKPEEEHSELKKQLRYWS